MIKTHSCEITNNTSRAIIITCNGQTAKLTDTTLRLIVEWNQQLDRGPFGAGRKIFNIANKEIYYKTGGKINA